MTTAGKRLINAAKEMRPIVTRDDLTEGSARLLDNGKLAIHNDCILVMQSNGTWVREDFADHVRTQADEYEPGEFTETATGQDEDK